MVVLQLLGKGQGKRIKISISVKHLPLSYYDYPIVGFSPHSRRAAFLQRHCFLSFKKYPTDFFHPIAIGFAFGKPDKKRWLMQELVKNARF